MYILNMCSNMVQEKNRTKNIEKVEETERGESAMLSGARALSLAERVGPLTNKNLQTASLSFKIITHCNPETAIAHRFSIKII